MFPNSYQILCKNTSNIKTKNKIKFLNLNLLKLKLFYLFTWLLCWIRFILCLSYFSRFAFYNWITFQFLFKCWGIHIHRWYVFCFTLSTWFYVGFANRVGFLISAARQWSVELRWARQKFCIIWLGNWSIEHIDILTILKIFKYFVTYLLRHLIIIRLYLKQLRKFYINFELLIIVNFSVIGVVIWIFQLLLYDEGCRAWKRREVRHEEREGWRRGTRKSKEARWAEARA